MTTVTGEVHELSLSGRMLFDSLVEDVQITRVLTVRGFTDDDYDHAIASLQRMIEILKEHV